MRSSGVGSPGGARGRRRPRAGCGRRGLRVEGRRGAHADGARRDRGPRRRRRGAAGHRAGLRPAQLHPPDAHRQPVDAAASRAPSTSSKGAANRGQGRRPHQVITTVTDLTKVIDGVRTVVIWERDINDGRLLEGELAFQAQDDDGNVWNLGEYPEEYDRRPGRGRAGHVDRRHRRRPRRDHDARRAGAGHVELPPGVRARRSSSPTARRSCARAARLRAGPLLRQRPHDGRDEPERAGGRPPAQVLRAGHRARSARRPAGGREREVLVLTRRRPARPGGARGGPPPGAGGRPARLRGEPHRVRADAAGGSGRTRRRRDARPPGSRSAHRADAVDQTAVAARGTAPRTPAGRRTRRA